MIGLAGFFFGLPAQIFQRNSGKKRQAVSLKLMGSSQQRQKEHNSLVKLGCFVDESMIQQGETRRCWFLVWESGDVYHHSDTRFQNAHAAIVSTNVRTFNPKRK